MEKISRIKNLEKHNLIKQLEEVKKESIQVLEKLEKISVQLNLDKESYIFDKIYSNEINKECLKIINTIKNYEVKVIDTINCNHCKKEKPIEFIIKNEKNNYVCTDCLIEIGKKNYYEKYEKNYYQTKNEEVEDFIWKIK